MGRRPQPQAGRCPSRGAQHDLQLARRPSDAAGRAAHQVDGAGAEARHLHASLAEAPELSGRLDAHAVAVGLREHVSVDDGIDGAMETARAAGAALIAAHPYDVELPPCVSRLTQRFVRDSALAGLAHRIVPDVVTPDSRVIPQFLADGLRLLGGLVDVMLIGQQIDHHLDAMLLAQFQPLLGIRAVNDVEAALADRLQ